VDFAVALRPRRGTYITLKGDQMEGKGIDVEIFRTTADLLRKSEEQLATARRRLEAVINRHDGPCNPKDDEPTDAELAAIVAEGRSRLAKQAPPCPDCRGRSGVAVADVVSGLCRACQAERLRIEFGEACPSLAALRRVGVNVLPPRDALAMEFDPAIFEEVA
jgi:hypothetical protein